MEEENKFAIKIVNLRWNGFADSNDNSYSVYDTMHHVSQRIFTVLFRCYLASLMYKWKWKVYGSSLTFGMGYSEYEWNYKLIFHWSDFKMDVNMDVLIMYSNGCWLIPILVYLPINFERSKNTSSHTLIFIDSFSERYSTDHVWILNTTKYNHFNRFAQKDLQFRFNV